MENITDERKAELQKAKKDMVKYGIRAVFFAIIAILIYEFVFKAKWKTRKNAQKQKTPYQFYWYGV